ncbi:MAG: hypothetical protein ACLQVL_05660, partial [Terriglobia bacterium]
RYSFLVRIFHPLLPAGLSRRFPVRVFSSLLHYFETTLKYFGQQETAREEAVRRDADRKGGGPRYGLAIRGRRAQEARPCPRLL